ncbi:hdhd3 [Symbiodinium sp. CCMP2592]|nr:hdhd3 [Symbiodinium sp. CCMP2592]
MSPRPNLWPAVKAVSLDVSALLAPRLPVPAVYAAAAQWAKLESPPTQEELCPAFQKARQDAQERFPCFGHGEGWSAREWWAWTARRTLANCGRDYTEAEFNRFFRRVYQHYGSQGAFEELADAKPFLEWTRQQGLTVGVTTNEDARVLDTTLPMLGFHDFMRWFITSQEVGYQKPNQWIYVEVWREASLWVPGLRREEILHVGSSYEEDFCGARDAGLQALLLDRGAENAAVDSEEALLLDRGAKNAVVDPEKAADSPSQSAADPEKTGEDVEVWTLRDLGEVQLVLEQGIIQQLR